MAGPAGARILIRGAGDMATGGAHRLWRAGWRVFMTELSEPRAVLRATSFSECVFRGRWQVEGVTAVRVGSAAEALCLVGRRPEVVPVIVDPGGRCLRELDPAVLVDARMTKCNPGTTLRDAPWVVGLGPGFTAGEDVHVVVETAWGPSLGRVIRRGRAREFDGRPHAVCGYTVERVLRAPCAGVLRALKGPGDIVRRGEVVGWVTAGSATGRETAGTPVRTRIDGLLKGLLRDGAPVEAGQKMGEVDPRGDAGAVRRISDKARAVGEGVLNAVTGRQTVPVRVQAD